MKLKASDVFESGKESVHTTRTTLTPEQDKRFDEKFKKEYPYGDWFKVIGKDLKHHMAEEIERAVEAERERIKKEVDQVDDWKACDCNVHHELDTRILPKITPKEAE